jgi:hypothetical protein
VLANTAAPYLLQNATVNGDTATVQIANSVVTYPVWVGPGQPGLVPISVSSYSVSTIVQQMQQKPLDGGLPLEMPFSVGVSAFCQVPLSNGYNIDVWALGGSPN